MILHEKQRWFFSELEDVPDLGLQPVVRAYAREWNCLAEIQDPVSGKYYGMVLCRMTLDQIEAARLDMRITCCDTLYDSNAKICPKMAAILANKGVTADMTVYDALKHLSVTVHPAFEPHQ